jgi:hypothetical protein
VGVTFPKAWPYLGLNSNSGQGTLALVLVAAGTRVAVWLRGRAVEPLDELLYNAPLALATADVAAVITIKSASKFATVLGGNAVLVLRPSITATTNYVNKWLAADW